MTETIRLEFPLCAEESRDAWVRPLLRQAISFVIEELGTSALDAVILTGSLARGEGSVLVSGGTRLLGDAEFLVIFRSPMDFPATRRRLVELSRRATRWIGAGGAVAEFEFSPAGLDYLRQNARPAIFTFDLLRHGKVVWGPRDLLGELPPFGAAEIPREDAVRLLMNRMVEQLQLVPRLVGGRGQEFEKIAYHHVKTTLDLAGSALAFAGCYASPYSERPWRFARLLERSESLRNALPDPEALAREVRRAAHLKLFPDPARLGSVGEETAERREELTLTLRRLARWFIAMWNWQMRELQGRPEAPFPELVRGYIERERFGSRLRGWAKFILHPFRPPRAFSALRAARHLWRASPQALTYAAALFTYANLFGEGDGRYAERAMRLLPLRPPRPGEGDLSQTVGELWTWLVRNN